MTAHQLGTVFGAFVGPLLVFGALLCMIKRGKMSFYEAVQNRWVVGFTVLTILANLANGLAPAAGLRVFNSDSELATFKTGCMESALTRMDRNTAGTACACVISEIESTLTRENFVGLMSTAAKTGVAAPAMEAIAAKCEPAQK
jgi:hypothetical protein